MFDNCRGQNKNRMVLRFMVVLTKLDIARAVHANFLIKGNTKNDCNGMFNLLKYEFIQEDECLHAAAAIGVH